MKRIAQLLIALTFTLAARGQVASSISPVQATLTIPDTKLLPGVPFDLWIDLRNTSNVSVGVGLCGDMVVRPQGGEPFTLVERGQEWPQYPTLLPADMWNGTAIRYLVLKPHGTAQLTLPILWDLAGPGYFYDDSLSKPGTYGISMRLNYCWGNIVPQPSLLPAEFLGPVMTNEVTIERVVPTGTDAVVWQRMQVATKGHWSPILWTNTSETSTVTAEILTKHRDSNYYPYALVAVTFGAVDEAAYLRFTDAIKRFPASPVVEMLELLACGTAPAHDIHVYSAHFGKVKASKRPTTRILAFGREDLPPEPCPPEVDECKD